MTTFLDINCFVKANEDDMKESIQKSIGTTEFGENPEFIKASNNNTSKQICPVKESHSFTLFAYKTPVKDFPPPVLKSRPKPLMRILLAEGDSLLRKSLASYLSFNSFKIIQVGDGVEALSEIKKSKFDLMILELKMPQIGGLEIINIVRNELMLTTPIIILSGSGVEEVEVESLQMGANDFISKPFSPMVIKARMDKLLENARRKFIKIL